MMKKDEKKKSESESFTGDISTEIHLPGPTNEMTGPCISSMMSLEVQSSEPSTEDIVDAGSSFHFLIVAGKKLC